MEIAVVISALLLMALGIVLGYAIGEKLSELTVTSGEYWRMNATVIVVGILVSALISLTGFVLFIALTIGMIAGAITGLKFGFGESVGPWKAHDRAFKVNKDMLDVAESGRGEARRRRKKDGGPEPELMSTLTDSQQSYQDKSEGSTQE